MSYDTQLENDWTVAIDCKATRERIMREALEAITFRASGQAVREAHPPTEGAYGFPGVDKWSPKARTFRARISLWDCSQGRWVRINKNGFSSAAEAGFWYVCTHIAFWGSLSVHADEVSVEVYEALVS
jgi:hypothetical protein